MKVYIVSGEAFVPHAEFSGNLGVFNTKEKAELFIDEQYNEKINNLDPYFRSLRTDSAFDDCYKYIYCNDGYSISWKIEEFEIE